MTNKQTPSNELLNLDVLVLVLLGLVLADATGLSSIIKLDAYNIIFTLNYFVYLAGFAFVVIYFMQSYIKKEMEEIKVYIAYTTLCLIILDVNFDLGDAKIFALLKFIFYLLVIIQTPYIIIYTRASFGKNDKLYLLISLGMVSLLFLLKGFSIYENFTYSNNVSFLKNLMTSQSLLITIFLIMFSVFIAAFKYSKYIFNNKRALLLSITISLMIGFYFFYKTAHNLIKYNYEGIYINNEINNLQQQAALFGNVVLFLYFITLGSFDENTTIRTLFSLKEIKITNIEGTEKTISDKTPSVFNYRIKPSILSMFFLSLFSILYFLSYYPEIYDAGKQIIKFKEDLGSLGNLAIAVLGILVNIIPLAEALNKSESDVTLAKS